MIKAFDFNLLSDEVNIESESEATKIYNGEDDYVNKEENSVLDVLIDLLPFELNFPGGYESRSGTGTHLDQRLQQGDQGINPLDKACLQHDLA